MPVYTIIYPESYIKRARRFLGKHPALARQYPKTLEILEVKPFHPSLRLHPLKGRLAGLHAVSINVSYRITLEFFFNEKEIILVHVGSHEEVY